MNMDAQDEIKRLKANLDTISGFVGQQFQEIITTQRAHADLLRALVKHLHASAGVQLLHHLREQLHREGAFVETVKEHMEDLGTSLSEEAMQKQKAFLEQREVTYRRALENALPKEVLVTVFPSSR